MHQNPRATTQEWQDFCTREDVQDLQRQLSEGLVHPLEYADSIMELGYKLGLIE